MLAVIDIDQGESGHKHEHFSGKMEGHHYSVLYLIADLAGVEEGGKSKYMYGDHAECCTNAQRV